MIKTAVRRHFESNICWNTVLKCHQICPLVCFLPSGCLLWLFRSTFIFLSFLDLGKFVKPERTSVSEWSAGVLVNMQKRLDDLRHCSHSQPHTHTHVTARESLSRLWIKCIFYSVCMICWNKSYIDQYVGLWGHECPAFLHWPKTSYLNWLHTCAQTHTEG